MRLILLLTLLLFIPSHVHAHTNGLPIVKINDKLAPPNQAMMAKEDPNFIISQDIAPEKYLPNTPLKFEIIEENTGLPQSIVELMKYRWKWTKDGTDVVEGPSASHTFKEVGSQLVTLEAFIPGNPDYVVLDTIQVDIVPSKEYILPKAIITTPNEVTPHTDIKFTAEISTDPSADIRSYQWKLDSNTYATDPSPTHIYKKNNLFEYVYLTVTDSQGISTTTVKSIYTKTNETKPEEKLEDSKNSNVLITSALSGLLVAAVLFIALRKKHKA